MADDVFPVTTARRQLFELVEDLLRGERDRVELTLRTHEERIVLVRKSVLDGQAADLKALREGAGLEAVPLRGMASLNVDPGDVVTRLRARQAELAARRRSTLSRD